MRTGSEVLSTGAAVPAVGTWEGYECKFQHNAPNKGVSSQDGGRLGAGAHARAQHSWSEFLKVAEQSHAYAMLSAQRSRCRHVIESTVAPLSRFEATAATN